MGVAVVAPAVMLPAPLWVHNIVPFVLLAPLTVNAAFSQVSASGPASTVGPSVMAICLVDVTNPQLAVVPVTVSSNDTVLFASAATGV